MRSGAFRRLIAASAVLLTGILVLGGCASAAKRQYLRHLSVTIAPSIAPAGIAARATASANESVIATAETNQPKP